MFFLTTVCIVCVCVGVGLATIDHTTTWLRENCFFCLEGRDGLGGVWVCNIKDQSQQQIQSEKQNNKSVKIL